MPRTQVRPARAPEQAEVESRRAHVIVAAARLFARAGFDATSMRDIAEECGILPGSLYYHFRSKADLFIAAHEWGVAAQERAVMAAVDGIEDSWDRLSAAAAAHCAALLEGEPPIVSTPTFPASIAPHGAKLVRGRDAYEGIFAQLISALPLPESTDRRLFRLHFLGALNWVPQWYKSRGRLSPEQIGHGLVAMVRGASPEADIIPLGRARAASRPRSIRAQQR